MVRVTFVVVVWGERNGFRWNPVDWYELMFFAVGPDRAKHFKRILLESFHLKMKHVSHRACINDSIFSLLYLTGIWFVVIAILRNHA